MKASLILAVAFALAGSFPSAWEKKATAAPEKAIHRNVNADEFEKLSKEPDTVILDVRSPKEYAAGHIKNSVLIDFNGKDFDEKIKQLDKGKTYLVHCAVGGRSAKACTKMDNYDFPKVVNLEGGIKAWEKAGKPVEK
jgi:rhodanese-related sulfurtransferase